MAVSSSSWASTLARSSGDNLKRTQGRRLALHGFPATLYPSNALKLTCWPVWTAGRPVYSWWPQPHHPSWRRAVHWWPRRTCNQDLFNAVLYALNDQNIKLIKFKLSLAHQEEYKRKKRKLFNLLSSQWGLSIRTPSAPLEAFDPTQEVWNLVHSGLLLLLHLFLHREINPLWDKSNALFWKYLTVDKSVLYTKNSYVEPENVKQAPHLLFF